MLSNIIRHASRSQSLAKYLPSPLQPSMKPWNLSSIRSLFIQTEQTPNPESIKFIPGREVLPPDQNETGFFVTKNDTAEIARSPLAKSLFSLDGVKAVYLGPDFVTITKNTEAHWTHIRTSIFGKIMDHYSSGKPAVTESPEITDTTILDDDDEVVAMIKELLESRIRPAVQEDGGDIYYEGFEPETGIVRVKLAGSCVGCPSSSVTLKNGVENMLMHYIPEVTAVHSVEEEENEGAGEVVVEKVSQEEQKQKTYEERLKAAGIPFAD